MDNNQIIELVVNKNNIVTKSNRLIEAEYKMSATEFKIVQTVFSNIQPNSAQDAAFVFPIRQFMDMLELKGESGYSELKKITLNLFKPIQITVDGETKQLSWFQLVNYNEKSGTVTIEVNNFWKEFLYSLEGSFTSYKLLNITHLTSSYSPRIYELLKSRVGLNSQRIISLKELRAKVGVQEGQYPKYANFKQRVLLPAQKELKAQSDIYFDFNEIKHGRSVSHIEFIIHRNNHNKVIEPKIEKKETTQGTLLKYGLSKEIVEELMKKYSEQRIVENIEYTIKRNDSSKINNIAAYLKTAIEKNYASQVVETKQKRSKDYDKFDEEMAKKNKNDEKVEDYERIVHKTPEEFEQMLVEIMEMRTRMGVGVEVVENDLKRNMHSYQIAQDKIKGSLISPNKFNNPIVKKVCMEVIQNLYS